MTTYNGEKYLQEQIESILNQSIQDFELVICDDCSADTTWDLLVEWQNRDERIHCYRNKENLGFKKNFEKAIRLCSGDYIALSDQDDIWTEEHLQVLVENLGKRDLIGANAFLCDKNANPVGTDLLSCSKIDFLPETQDEWFFFLLHSNIFQGSACLFRKSIVEKALPIPESVQFHDYWFALIAASNNGVKYINECILYYRQHEKNITTNEKWNLLKKVINNQHSIADSKMKEDILLALNEFVESCNKYRNLIDNAILYHRSKKNSFYCLSYFWENYKYIYLSKRFCLFFFRLLKHLLIKI